MTKSAALEAASSGVRVNAIAPGPVQTDMMERFVGRDADARSSFVASDPAGRAGSAEEIADAIVFLGSDKAASFNGQSILVDGGYNYTVRRVQDGVSIAVGCWSTHRRP